MEEFFFVQHLLPVGLGLGSVPTHGPVEALQAPGDGWPLEDLHRILVGKYRVVPRVVEHHREGEGL